MTGPRLDILQTAECGMPYLLAVYITLTAETKIVS